MPVLWGMQTKVAPKGVQCALGDLGLAVTYFSGSDVLDSKTVTIISTAHIRYALALGRLDPSPMQASGWSHGRQACMGSGCIPDCESMFVLYCQTKTHNVCCLRNLQTARLQPAKITTPLHTLCKVEATKGRADALKGTAEVLKGGPDSPKSI